jgi:hypothetical protein
MRRTEGQQEERIPKANQPGTHCIRKKSGPNLGPRLIVLAPISPFHAIPPQSPSLPQHSRLASGKRPDLGIKGRRRALPRTIGAMPALIAEPRFRASGFRSEPRAWSCPAPRGGACAPRPAPASSARPVSATAARRARHVASAARPPGSGLRRGAGREDGRTERRTLVGTVRRSAGGPGTDGQGAPGHGRAGGLGAQAGLGAPAGAPGQRRARVFPGDRR